MKIIKKTNTPIISNKNPIMLNHTKPNNLTKYLKKVKEQSAFICSVLLLRVILSICLEHLQVMDCN